MASVELKNIVLLRINNSDTLQKKVIGETEIITHSGFHEMHDRKPIKQATVISVHPNCDEDIKVGDTAMIAFVVDTQDTYLIDKDTNGDKIVALRCKNTYCQKDELQGYAYINGKTGDRFYCGMPDFILQFRHSFQKLTPEMQEKWKEVDDRYEPKNMKEQRQLIYEKGQPIFRSMIYGIIRDGVAMPTSDFVITEDVVESEERVTNSGIILLKQFDKTTVKKDSLYRGTITHSKIPALPIGATIISEQYSNINVDLNGIKYTFVDKEDVLALLD
jgi:co-chaperonin GroES (HSP10)